MTDKNIQRKQTMIKTNDFRLKFFLIASQFLKAARGRSMKWPLRIQAAHVLQSLRFQSVWWKTLNVVWFSRSQNSGCSNKNKNKVIPIKMSVRKLARFHLSASSHHLICHRVRHESANSEHSEGSWCPRWEAGGVQPVSCSSSSNTSLWLLPLVHHSLQ